MGKWSAEMTGGIYNVYAVSEEESVSGMLATIDQATKEQTANFLDYVPGNSWPW